MDSGINEGHSDYSNGLDSPPSHSAFSGPGPEHVLPGMTTSPALAMASQLRDLKQLHSEGILSDKEFSTEKSLLLEQSRQGMMESASLYGELTHWLAPGTHMHGVPLV